MNEDKIMIAILTILFSIVWIMIFVFIAGLIDFYNDYKCSTTTDIKWYNEHNCIRYCKECRND